MVEGRRMFRIVLSPAGFPNFCHTSLSRIAQQYVDGYAFLHVHCNTKSQENPTGPKFSILEYHIKKMCMLYSSSWIIFLKFKRQAI